jgi:predicted DNA-binding transcriptional regulator AlpA
MIKREQITRNNERKAYRVLEFAELCGISKNLAYQMVNNKQIGSIRVGLSRKCIIIPGKSIDEFLATASKPRRASRKN